MWLLALLSILAFMMTTTFACAEEVTKGHVEVGISGMDTDDNPARVNEYVNTRSKEGFSFAPKASLENTSGNSAFGFEADIAGPRDQEFSLEFDAKRIFKLNFDYQVLEHWKDHETLDQMGATLAGDAGSGQPNVTTDKMWAELYELPTPITKVGGQDPIAGTYDPATAYSQELSNEYIVTRRELENEIELALPVLPNIVFHAGLRIETREGLEQAIGLSKCAGCHVSAEGKNINERTEDFTFGVTGKFGIATVEYEYLNRTFEENAGTPSRYYATNDKFDQLLYKGDEFEYANTPESDKDVHSLKLRVDLPNSTSVTGSYVKSNVESNKSDLVDSGYTLQSDVLKTEYESFGAKLSTVFGQNWRFSLRGSTYEIDADNNVLTFADRADYIAAYPTGTIADLGLDDDWNSAEERKTTELGLDAVYRLAKGTTLRLGYEYEEIERVEEELGETETHTFKVALKSRINKELSGRLSYQYQDIDDPFAGDDATGIYQGTGTVDTTNPDSGLMFAILDPGSFYWDPDAVYPERTLEATNQPDAVHEAKASATWAPSANMAATFFARVRLEENDNVEYKQATYVPGASLWYAPNSKVNLTMAYTFSKQDTENRACVGWYHG
jgi:hypothetical protein